MLQFGRAIWPALIADPMPIQDAVQLLTHSLRVELIVITDENNAQRLVSCATIDQMMGVVADNGMLYPVPPSRIY